MKNASRLLTLTRAVELAALLAAGWLGFALVADPWALPEAGFPAPAPVQVASEDGPGALEPVLQTARRREMFRQSVLYAAEEKQRVDVLGDYQFVGVSAQGERRRAFVLNRKTGRSSLLAVGETLGDLRLEEIQTDRLVLTHKGEKLELIR